MERKVSGIFRARSSAPSPPLPVTTEDNGLIAIRYEENAIGKAPIPITVAPPHAPPTDTHPALRRTDEETEAKRDSGLESSKSVSGTSSTMSTMATTEEILGVEINFNSTPATTMTSLPAGASSPATTEAGERQKPKLVKGQSSSGSMSKWRRPRSAKSKNSRDGRGSTEDVFAITTAIPTDSLLEEDFLEQLSFSKRGSIMLGGKKAFNGHAHLSGGRRMPSFSVLASPSPKLLSEEVEAESKKVRSMYESGTGLDWQDGGENGGSPRFNIDDTIGEQDEHEESSAFLTPDNKGGPRPETSLSVRNQYELAGGIEDWEDIDYGDTDRWGFIDMNRKKSTPGSEEPRPGLQRVSTVLQLASDTPRKRRAFGRSPSFSGSPKSGVFRRASYRRGVAKSVRTQNTQTSKMSRASTRSNIRAAANHLPGNRDRKLMDEAGDMLTLPPGLADIAEDEEGGKAAAGMKRKEVERLEKWRKMAKVIPQKENGQGMRFEFDTRNPKLIERTWKGIPQRWRGAAWFSFLRSSAKKRKDSPTEEQLIAAFHMLQTCSSADDVQIDIDVPRTINSHIMFRRRYSGGQRFLFRVLHALSLYFPETGYVQGMASLAATILCLYDEENAFVMLARMWTLRGLDKLYEPGFPGLMAALDEFQTKWLQDSPVATKLRDLNIEPTAYGTRWYLTLFNYSIPFAAQLRVWDVFMLLGDPDISGAAGEEGKRDATQFGGGLDVLHATSAALIDGTREILLDSDFENAMKVLTSWIPVKDEELLMKVAKAEWKVHRKGRRLA